jgi:hypothetical protein
MIIKVTSSRLAYPHVKRFEALLYQAALAWGP